MYSTSTTTNSMMNSPLFAPHQAPMMRSNEPRNSLYRTELCRKFEEKGFCRYGDRCQFAHGLDQLRPMPNHPRYKTDPCKSFWSTGNCSYGAKCRFMHQEGADNMMIGGDSMNTANRRNELYNLSFIDNKSHFYESNDGSNAYGIGAMDNYGNSYYSPTSNNVDYHVNNNPNIRPPPMNSRLNALRPPPIFSNSHPGSPSHGVIGNRQGLSAGMYTSSNIGSPSRRNSSVSPFEVTSDSVLLAFRNMHLSTPAIDHLSENESSDLDETGETVKEGDISSASSTATAPLSPVITDTESVQSNKIMIDPLFASKETYNESQFTLFGSIANNISLTSKESSTQLDNNNHDKEEDEEVEVPE